MPTIICLNDGSGALVDCLPSPSMAKGRGEELGGKADIDELCHPFPPLAVASRPLQWDVTSAATFKFGFFY